MLETNPRPYSPWRGLTLQLFVLTILPLTVLLLFITVNSLSVHQRAMRALVGERDERAVRTASRALKSEIFHRASAVRSLALRAGNANSAALDDILSSSAYLQPDFEGGLAFFDHQGRLLSFSGEASLWEDLGSHGATWIEAVLSSDASPAYISPAFRDQTSSEALVLVAASSESTEIIAVGVFSPGSLAGRALEGAFASESQIGILLVDASGNALYESGSLSSGGEMGAYSGIEEALRGKAGTIYIGSGNDERVVAYAPVEPVGWAIVTEESWEMVATPTLRTSQVMPLALVPALLIAVVGLWFGIRQVVQPIQKLEEKAARLAWGDFGSIEEPVGGIPEVRHLQVELAQMARKLRAAQKGLRDYIGAITAAQEEERRRLARELHDDTIQSLIALKQRVQLTRLSIKERQAADSMAELEGLAEQTIDNLRRLTRALRPIYLEDLGLVTALEMLARETSQSAGVPVTFHLDGSERRLPPEVEMAFYRITQEALSNVIRHSKASEASVRLHYQPGSVSVGISDNGQGFEVPRSPAEFVPRGHFGLLGLHERAELLGARLEIRSAPGKGASIIVDMPT